MPQQSKTNYGLPETEDERASYQPRRAKALILAAVSLGQFMIQMDLTVVNVALPSIGRHLHGSTSGLQWVMDGYSLALASLLLLGGRIGDRSGHKRVYLAGLGIFGVGSGLCALAPSTGALIGFRALQGIGAAVELPATLAILSHTFTGQRERAQAVGIWAGAAGTSLVIGPVLGGGLTAAFGWPAIFIVNLPVVAIVALLTLVTVTEAAEPGAGRLDLPGQALGAAALALLAAGAIEGGQHGFASGLSLGLFAGGTVSLTVFIAVERVRSDPMLPLGFFRGAAYCAANGDGLVMGFVTVGILFLYPLFFQQVQGDTPLGAGLRFVPLTIAFVVTGPLIGRVIDKVGHRAPMAAGCILMGIGCLLLLRVRASSGYASVAWPFVTIGVGYGLTSTPMAAAVLGAVPRERAGMASATNLAARVVGGVFGVAVLGALLPTAQTARQAFDAAFTSGLHAALVVASVIALAGAGAAAAFITGADHRLPAACRERGNQHVEHRETGAAGPRDPGPAPCAEGVLRRGGSRRDGERGPLLGALRQDEAMQGRGDALSAPRGADQQFGEREGAAGMLGGDLGGQRGGQVLPPGGGRTQRHPGRVTDQVAAMPGLGEHETRLAPLHPELPGG
jgi:EmrB/QacA subfamily drug resistance transporter